ncbi:MAG: uroporphyrinogen decarboxylase [Micavibrio aeruginosavorus]|uniref:Uroporphyrinogen decarboxylase n=1 Tax=Micavibrio aeruginosavorus TaxID=349221 RepID=A0A2W5QCD5_9BACT|nr:MAG: uroporphyrinogen decarboxylase [Micavibrio aeruginosavorus]
MKTKSKPILDVLQRKSPERVPFWLMRQAGRYLPEYRALRAQTPSFLDLVYNPEKASEVTMQPIRRYGMDGAILFSDILVIPDALGQKVAFEAGEGPKLQALESEMDFMDLDLDRVEKHLVPVFETIKLTREKLSTENFAQTALLGFCGSPWTVACYMVQGHGGGNFDRAVSWAKENPDSFQTLINILTAASCIYLSAQIKAGVEAVQLFESHAGLLDGEQFERWVIAPTHKIGEYLKDFHGDVPVIGFPRNAGKQTLDYALETLIDCVGLDYDADLAWAAREISPHMPVQGNLDPVFLLAGGDAMREGLEKIRATLEGKPFIFNLGHGVIKETPPEHVEQLRDIVRGWKP